MKTITKIFVAVWLLAGGVMVRAAISLHHGDAPEHWFYNLS